jgi:hypothetical protein
MFITSKAKKSKNFMWGYPTEFAGSTQKHNKIAGTPYQPIKSKKNPKKVC